MFFRKKQEPIDPSRFEVSVRQPYLDRGSVPALAVGPYRSRGDGRYCCSCGQMLTSRTGNLNMRCNMILGRDYCDGCFKVLLPKAQVECKFCHKTVAYADATTGKCPECLMAELEEKREFYRDYTETLHQALLARGISTQKESLDGVHKNGCAAFPVLPVPGVDLNPLRNDLSVPHDERAIYTVSCRGARLAFPDNSISLRYLFLSPEFLAARHLRNFHPHEYILALASDGKELYMLKDDGAVISSAPDFSGFSLFDKQSEIRRYCSLIPTETIDRIIQETYASGTHNISATGRSICYDAGKKGFTEEVIHGNSHEGIEVVYEPISKEQVLRRMQHGSLYTLWHNCKNGIVPQFAIVDRL